MLFLAQDWPKQFCGGYKYFSKEFSHEQHLFLSRLFLSEHMLAFLFFSPFISVNRWCFTMCVIILICSQLHLVNPDFSLNIILLTQGRQVHLIFSHAINNVNNNHFTFFTMAPMLFSYGSGIFESKSTRRQGACL